MWLKVKAFFARIHWGFWAALLGVAGALAFLLRLLAKPTDTEPLPSAPVALQAKVAKVEEQALVAKVTATVKAEEQKTQLADIAKVDDGAERRRRLAAMLRGL